MSGPFSSIGSLFDSSPSKQFKKGRRDTLAALYGPGATMADVGPARLWEGSASSPFATGTFGPSGASYQFTPQIQNLFDRGITQAGVGQDILANYFGPNFLSEGTLFDQLNQSRLGRVEAGERAAANALGKIWNTGGVSTGTGFDATNLINQLNAAKAQEDYNVVANLLGLRKDALGQFGTSMDHLAGFDVLGRSTLQDARGLSSDLTNLDLQKINMAIAANNAYRQAKANEPGLGATLGGIADFALTAYGAGGGTFGGGQNPNFLQSMAQGMYPKRPQTFMDFLTQGGLQGSGARNPELTSLMSMLPDQALVDQSASYFQDQGVRNTMGTGDLLFDPYRSAGQAYSLTDDRWANPYGIFQSFR
tara:strand:- start:329 stop:1420 length:1092 start_codon:yes stop_codon:yes gene_type:complete